MFKSKEERNAYERRRRANSPEAARKAREATARSDAKHKEKRVAHHRLMRETYRDKSRAQNFKCEMARYGTTVEVYRDRLIEQRGLCAICEHLNVFRGKLQRLAFDHNHECCDTHATSCGECLRGLLCADCNIRLAPLEVLLKDFRNPETGEVDLRNSLAEGSWTSRALQYLKRYQK